MKIVVIGGNTGDTRRVVADTAARYFGAELQKDTLVPAGEARLGSIRFEDWQPSQGK